MTAKQLFRHMMAVRRKYSKGAAEYVWRTRAARQYYLMHRKVPTTEWRQV